MGARKNGARAWSNTVLFCPYVTQASCYNDADQELNGSTAGGGGGGAHSKMAYKGGRPPPPPPPPPTPYKGVQGEAPTGINFLFRL